MNVKAIVIGLMDRLSAYAAREAEGDAPEDRQKAETEATANLLEKLRIAKEKQTTEEDSTEDGQQNSESTDEPVAQPKDEETSSDKPADSEDATQSNGHVNKSRGIPDNIRLFEVFHEQVIHLVSMQRLPIQDITALLVSLINLAL